MRKDITLQRASLLGLAAGLGMIVQPWSHFLFAAGFPFTLAALAGYNAAGWLTGERAAKERALAKAALEARAPAPYSGPAAPGSSAQPGGGP